MHALAQTNEARHWPASLRLTLMSQGGRTRVVRNQHLGPLRLQRPFYPEAEAVAHLYVLHPPGGLVSGDDLHLEVDAGPGTRTLITTPSAGKVYRIASTGEPQRQTVHLKLGPGAQLEWLPQDNIVFNGARGELGLRVDLADQSRFFGWEICCLGRAAGAQPFIDGALLQRLELYREGRPWLLERMPLRANRDLLQSPWALDGHSVFATAVATLTHLDSATQKDVLAEARARLGSANAGVTVTRDLLVARLLDNDSEALRNSLIALWQGLRKPVMDRPAGAPRIWAT